MALHGKGRSGASLWPSPTWIVADEPSSHPWIADIEDLPPAKRLHVANLASALLQYGASRRSKVIDVIHPLISQPILEQCLALPVDLLVQGGRDRALAREAFRARLPSAVYRRRSKGELSAFHSWAMAAALPSLRAFLLDGRLCEQGLIDRARLEPVLEEAYLAQHGGILDILRAAAIEAWVRHWEGRMASLQGSPLALHRV
jgi:asparagine synthase (glutamine-hydrolysing)